jgi:hypothetical protein
MHIYRPWLFDLARFDEDDQPPADDPGSPETEPDDDPQADPEGADQLGDKGKRALETMKNERAAARREAAAAKRERDALAAKVAEFEDRDKSESERLAQRAERAEKAAQAATARAVKAEVKALASEAFADPTDADLLGDLTKYVADDGDIDTESIQADLDALLERKPHLRKQTATQQKKQPRPDPSQGPRKEPGPVDFRTADKATYEAALAEMGIRLR